MKFLTREQVFLINEYKLKINEKAVHWNQSVLGLLIDTVLSPFSWLKNMKGPKLAQLKVIAMQWGAEYARVSDEILNGIESNIEEPGDSETEDLVFSVEFKNEFLDNFSEYLKIIYNIIDELENSIKEYTKSNAVNIQTNLSKLKIVDQINGKSSEQLFDILNDFKNDIFKDINSIEKISDNLNEIAEYNDLYYKTPSLDNLTKYKESIVNYITLMISIKESIEKIDPATETTKESIINELRINDDVFELPSDVEDLYPIELLEKVKKIKNIREKTFKKLNLITLNTARHNANYIIESVDKGQDKLKHAFEQHILNINNYFQEVIDTNMVMKKITGQVDADTANIIQSNQDNLDEIQLLGIDEIQTSKTWDEDKVYLLNGSIRGAKNSMNKANLFLSKPRNDFNKIWNGDDDFLMQYLGSYKHDKKTNENVLQHPFFNSMSGNGKKLQDKSIYSLKYVLCTGLRTGNKKYPYIPVFYNETDKNVYFIYDDDFVTGDEFKSKSITKGKTIVETLSGLTQNNFTSIFNINQSYIVDTDKIESGIYPNLSSDDISYDKVIYEKIIIELRKIYEHIK